MTILMLGNGVFLLSMAGAYNNFFKKLVGLLNKVPQGALEKKISLTKKVGKFYGYNTKNSGFGHKMPFWGQNKPPKGPKIWPSEACFDPKMAFYGQILNFLYYICKIWQLFGLMKFFFSSAPWGTLFSNRTSFLKKSLLRFYHREQNDTPHHVQYDHRYPETATVFPESFWGGSLALPAPCEV